MTTTSDILAAMWAEAADLSFDLQIRDWLFDELLLEDAGEVGYYLPLQGEIEPEWPPVPEFALFIGARPVLLVEDGRHVGRWRVDRGIVDELGLPKRGGKLGYFGTLLEALEAIEAYIREVNP